MKTKRLNILFAGIFALVFLMGAVSAATFSNQVPSILPLTTGAQTFTVEINGTVGESITFSGLNSITENGKTITFTFTLDDDSTVDVTYVRT